MKKENAMATEHISINAPLSLDSAEFKQLVIYTSASPTIKKTRIL